MKNKEDITSVYQKKKIAKEMEGCLIYSKVKIVEESCKYNIS